MNHRRVARPDNWKSTSYTIRAPGQTAWLDGIETLTEARAVAIDAARRHGQKGLRVYAEQDYTGDLPELVGTRRTAEM